MLMFIVPYPGLATLIKEREAFGLIETGAGGGERETLS